jgi:hypothetical protein
MKVEEEPPYAGSTAPSPGLYISDGDACKKFSRDAGLLT